MSSKRGLKEVWMLNKAHKVLLGLKGSGVQKVDLIQNNLAIQYVPKIQEVWKLHKVIKIQEERFMRSEILTNIPINYLNNYRLQILVALQVGNELKMNV